VKKLGMLGIIGGAALLTAAPFSLQWSEENVALSINSADAQIGPPPTATSVAGVHRRVYRRTYRRAAYPYGYGSYYGYGSPYHSSYYAPQPYLSYYVPVGPYKRTTYYPLPTTYPPSRYSYYLPPFATVSSYASRMP
jgi:hypothetical protein